MTLRRTDSGEYGGEGMSGVDLREKGRAIGDKKYNQLIKEFCSTQMQKNEETAPMIF